MNPDDNCRIEVTSRTGYIENGVIDGTHENQDFWMEYTIYWNYETITYTMRVYDVIEMLENVNSFEELSSDSIQIINKNFMMSIQFLVILGGIDTKQMEDENDFKWELYNNYDITDCEYSFSSVSEIILVD